MSPLPTVLVILCGALAADQPQINPVPRAVLVDMARQWTFDKDREDWIAQNECSLSAVDGLLTIRSAGSDPYFHQALDLPGGHMALTLRARSRTTGVGSIFWTTDQLPHRSEQRAVHFKLQHDGQWHEYTARFHAPGQLTDLRIDPGQGEGMFEIDWIRLDYAQPHPLMIQRVDATDRPDQFAVRFVVKNDRLQPIEFSAAGRNYTVDGGATVVIERPTDPTTPMESVTLEMQADEMPLVRRTVFVHHPQAKTDWLVKSTPQPSDHRREKFVSIDVAPDGSMARIRRDGKLVAILGPLVLVDGRMPKLELVEDGVRSVRFRGEGVELTLAVEANDISVKIDSQSPCEGPIVRALGDLQQGLFAGLEYLGRGEQSSTTLDIETSEHLRFAPDSIKVTMPLTAFLTDRASVAMTWRDMQLEPTFATPNFFDGTEDHRMALRGRKIEATVRIDRSSLEEAILWAVDRAGGLPPLPEPPRTPEEQWKLCLKALDGPIKSDEGWGHCAGERWARRPYADIASTIWRLSGNVPDFPQFVPGGAHVENESIYFVTGRAQWWLDHKSRQVRGILDRQQADGSFRYDGKYRRGHFENTASGVCARPAATLLEFARVTGDRKALEAGVRALQYMKRFRTPRGAQVWEVPLHTPDQLASAYLVWAYIRGYELTDDETFLIEAKKWAASGIPFVYLWSRYPTMLYATPPVYGATNWRAPVWIGLPVQWVGGVYAYALTMLAKHDDSFDWNHLARGILISAEQQQYPDGEWVGLLPDVFSLEDQQRHPARINPCGIASLRMALDGQLDFLSVATDGQHRVAAPFPVSFRYGEAHIRAKRGTTYQAIIDGQRIVEVKSNGNDVIRLD
ncbi:MAG: hypothetical protein V3R99_07480 [Thermoguttaceae bacterium]